MKIIGKTLLGTAAAGAMALGAIATPAQAQERYDNRDRGGIDTGTIIAGAVILGGLAAVLGVFDDDDDRYRDDRYRDQRYPDQRYGDQRYQRGNNGRQAVDQCVRIAENQAQRAGYRYADVYEIYDVDQKRNGWKIKGRIAVDGQRNSRDNRYQRRSTRDEGKFTCEVENGRIRGLNFSGVRGLR